jgi:hypothetical protein
MSFDYLIVLILLFFHVWTGGNVAPAIAGAAVELESKIAQKQLKQELHFDQKPQQS